MRRPSIDPHSPRGTELLFYALMACGTVIILGGCGLARLAITHNRALAPIDGRQAGEILKPQPQLVPEPLR